MFANGNLTHYLVEWTIMNKTHAENVTIHQGKNIFRIPYTTDNDRFNITIRAVSEFGAGIPIYIDLRNMGSFPSGKSMDTAVKSHDPRLGIAIGVLLSVICVIVCMWIIVRHRQCVKTRQQTGMNGGIAHHQYLHRPMNAERTTATALFTTPPNAITPNCVIDVHEMQTLIVTPAANDKLEIKNGRNGGWKCAENGNNGKYVAVIERDADGTRHSDDEDDNEYECSRRGLISSTPKGQRKSIVIVASNNSSEQNSSTNSNQNTADSVTTQLNDDIDAFAMVASSSRTNILTNGSLRNLTENLPQDNGSHSIPIHENDWRTVSTTTAASAIAKPTQNGNVKRHSQPMEMSLDTATIFDNSQKKLLDSTIDSSSSSSSSCSSQNSSSNNRCKINCKNNSNDNIHTEVRPIKYNELDHNHFQNSVESIANQRSSSPSDTTDAITNGVDANSDEKCPNTEQPSTIDLNEDSYFQKRLQKWDYRRPIVGPNG